jgi:hypothetical protein
MIESFGHIVDALGRELGLASHILLIQFFTYTLHQIWGVGEKLEFGIRVRRILHRAGQR